ncbi:hypothetical protein [Legionella fallonii]|uniref:Transposase n=1 Tax=Legionella fallonii LLAP-10 TaxID=1212491 RepID=A0A098G7N2_9GAMM|nr:hypothetical protein [Legionella fallonii]CEG57974.1 protein of unknown function [Legionella fallonii LLAP-10]
MGKTEFLKKDFIPVAEKAGYLVVYTNLWELKIDPATALVSKFYKIIEPKGFAKIWSNLNTPINIKKLKTSGKIPGLGEGTVKADLPDPKKLTGTLLMEAMSSYDRKKRFKKTTITNPKAKAAPNLLNQNFAADRPNQRWVADITYVATAQGYFYC